MEEHVVKVLKQEEDQELLSIYKNSLMEATEIKMKSLSVVKSETNALQLPFEIWEYITSFMSENDLVALSSVCTWFQWIVHKIKPSFNLAYNCRLNIDCLLNYALSKTCTSVNINHCFWLKPGEILEIISRTNLKHFYVIDCHVNEEVMKAICNLSLESFAFTYSPEWKSYLVEHREESAVFLQRLITLKIHVKDKVYLDVSEQTILFDVYINVLRYCDELQQLMMTDYGWRHANLFLNAPPPPQLPPHSTSLMPKLKRLVLDIDFRYFHQTAVDILEAILKDKVVPFEHVDCGILNCYLLQEGIRHHPLILPEKETLFLTNRHYHPFNLGSCLNNKSLMCQNSFKKIWLENIEIEKFTDFADKIISNSGKCIEKLYLRKCWMLENISRGIELFTLSCLQITELDLTILNWLVKDNTIHPQDISDVEYRNYWLYDSSTKIDKNKALLCDLANLKNLKKLWISPLMLQCVYYTWDLKISVVEMPFYAVTIACKQLRELHISSSNYDSLSAVVDETSLYAIAFCKNLKALYLRNFDIRVKEEFVLSEITESCPHLENLGIGYVTILRNSQQTTHKFVIENSFHFLKSLKTLRVDSNVPYSATVIDSLVQCQHLEKLEVKIDGENNIRYLMDSLPKFENLCLLSISINNGGNLFEALCSATQKISDQKPAFYATVQCQGHNPFKTKNCGFNIYDYFDDHSFYTNSICR